MADCKYDRIEDFFEAIPSFKENIQSNFSETQILQQQL